ncbi:MAG: hypothetical protein AAGN35_14270 [Bacteroidota bacterium]
MRKIVPFLIFLFAAGGLAAQWQAVRAGYWGSLAYRPGFKVAAEYGLANWEKAPNRGKSPKQRQLFVGPELGTFAIPSFSNYYLIGAEGGIRLARKSSKSVSAFSLSTGYLGESDITSLNVDLSDGAVVSRTREWASYFLVTWNYAYQLQLAEKLDGFARLSLGRRFGPVSSANVFLGLGLRVRLNATQ